MNKNVVNLRKSKIAVLPNGDRLKYSEYIVSPHWREKHALFLKKGGYRCSFMPWLKIGKGKRYACHHTGLGYQNLGQEFYGRDVLIMHPKVHMWFIHGILSGFKSASRQRSPYPNTGQKLVHAFCRLPVVVKMLVWAALFAGIPVFVLSYFNPELGLVFVVAIAAFVLFRKC
jgi:hypothetical protein